MPKRTGAGAVLVLHAVSQEPVMNKINSRTSALNELVALDETAQGTLGPSAHGKAGARVRSACVKLSGGLGNVKANGWVPDNTGIGSLRYLNRLTEQGHRTPNYRLPL
jgi:hypothetical protein